jgi:hypothetical protein
LPAAELPLRFILPGTNHMIVGTGEVTWADDCGRAGILFRELTPAARRQLRTWLGKRIKSKARRHTIAPRALKARPSAAPAH